MRESKEKVYLAGPMRGKEAFNFPAFDEAARVLRHWGCEVFNPAERDRTETGFTGFVDGEPLTGNEDLAELGFDLREALGADLEFITREADTVVVLPGWRESKGVAAEVAAARALGLPVYEYHRNMDTDDYNDCDLIEVPADEETITLNGDGEVRTVSSTGGEKGVKPERFELIPVEPLEELARLYGAGAKKYSPWNWRLGYEWSKSIGALERHLKKWVKGESVDPENGCSHLASVVFHAFTLMVFEKEQPDFDDRWRG